MVFSVTIRNSFVQLRHCNLPCFYNYRVQYDCALESQCRPAPKLSFPESLARSLPAVFPYRGLSVPRRRYLNDRQLGDVIAAVKMRFAASRFHEVDDRSRFTYDGAREGEENYSREFLSRVNTCQAHNLCHFSLPSFPVVMSLYERANCTRKDKGEEIGSIIGFMALL